MGRKKHGSLNPTDKFRKDQRKKELRKNKDKRAVVRDTGLMKKDVTQIQTQIQKINAVAEKTGKLDKATKVKKRKLETQMVEVIKRKKDLEGSVPTREEYANAMTMPVSAKSVDDLEEQNQYRYENPELSVYYHPTLNPYGAPPPGASPMFRATSAANLLTGTKEGMLALPSTEPHAPKSEEPAVPLPPGPPPAESNVVDEELESIPLPPGPPEEEEFPPLPDTPPPETETPVEPPPMPPGFHPLPFPGAPYGMYPMMHPMMHPMGFLPPGAMPRPRFGPPMPLSADAPFAYIPPPTHFGPPMSFPPGIPPYGQMPPHMRPPQLQQQQVEPTPPPGPAPGPQLPEEEEPSVLVPTALRVRRDTAIKPQMKPTIASAYIKPKKEAPVAKPKDQAYDKFMKDMKDLGAV